MTMAEYTRLVAQIAVLKDHREHYRANGSEKEGGLACRLNPKTNLATQRTGRKLERGF